MLVSKMLISNNTKYQVLVIVSDMLGEVRIEEHKVLVERTKSITKVGRIGGEKYYQLKDC